jgi:hypothetical protein
MARKSHSYESSSLSRKDIIVNNFLGGISWAIGGTVGLAVIIWILALLASNGKLIPVVGNFVADVAKYAELKNGRPLGH